MITGVAKEYLELEGLLLLFPIIWEQWSLGVSLKIGWLLGTIAAGTLASGGGSGGLESVYGREIAIIYCNALIAHGFSSQKEKGDYGNRFFTASSISSNVRQVQLVEEEPGMWQLCGKNLIFFATYLDHISGTYTV